jgi:hypothetical protein
MGERVKGLSSGVTPPTKCISGRFSLAFELLKVPVLPVSTGRRDQFLLHKSVKVKLSLCVINHYALKAYEGVDV